MRPLQRTKVALDDALQAAQNINAENEVLFTEKAETQRLLQETRLSLEAKNQENADLILQNQVIITERDNALGSLAEVLADAAGSATRENSLRNKIKRLEQTYTRDIEATKT
jgi:hypothetical protein